MRYRPSPVQRAILLALCASTGGSAIAGPQGGVVAAGQASITQSGALTQIQQNSQRAITHWKSFDIARGEMVRVIQPSSSAAMLARVTGGLGRSTLDGTLQTNGQFFLINPQGVIVGRDAVIDTGAFLASTLSTSDRDFMAGGPLRFAGDSAAGIVNLGSISASNGSVTLVARQVANYGAIDAPQGSATLGAATEFLLSAPDQPAVLVRGVASTSGGTAVDNAGVVSAARVQLEAAGGDLYDLAVNQAGVVRATGVTWEQGRAVITAQGGKVVLSGSVSAHNVDGSGGDVRVGGGPRGRDANTANAAQTELAATALIDVSARGAQGSGGTATVWSDRATSVFGSMSARGASAGGDGGLVEVSSARSLLLRPAAPVDLRAPRGRLGTLLLDPDDLTITANDGGANTLTADSLQTQLGSGNVVLDTSSTAGDIRFATAVSWSNSAMLTVNSANNIHVDAPITAPNGTLRLYAGALGAAADQSNFLDGQVNIASGATIRTDRLVLGRNSQTLAGYFYDPAAPTVINANGKLDVNTLELDLAGGAASLTARHADNRISALRTSNSTGSSRVESLDVSSSSGAMELMLAAGTATVQVVTPGDVTIKSGTSLTLDSGVKAVIASTAGNVRNEAGASAIGGSGSHLIYTGSASLTDKGGLGGSDEFSRSLGSNPPGDYTDGNSRFLFRASGSSLPQLTYRADNKSRLYGDANPLLTYSIADIDGPVLASSLSGVVSGEPLLSTTAVATSSVQSYAINISLGTLSSSTYDFNFVNGQFSVQPAPLTFNTRAARRDYGDANPTFSADLVGLKNSDTAESLLATVQFSSTADAATGVGTRPINITAGSSTNANYNYTLNSGTLTIDPAPVTLALPALSRAYGGANPDFIANLQPSGLKNGQSISTAFPALSLSTTANATSAVGSYAVTASGASNANYAVTTNFTPLEVTRATLGLRVDNKSRLYGDANPAFTTTLTGLRNGDTASVISGLQFNTSANLTSPVGAYAINASGANASNYTIQYTQGTLDVTAAPLQVTVNNQTRVFGNANPLLTYSVSGLRNSDVAPAFSLSTSATELSPVGNYAIQASGSLANYSVNVTPGNLSVTRRPVTLAAVAQSREYGSANPALTFTSEGLLPADEIYRNYWRVTANAGLTSAVGLYTLAVGLNPDAAPLINVFTNLPNYDVSFVNTGLTIRRAPLTVTANPAEAIWGDARPALTYSVSGLRNGDASSVLSGVRLTTAPEQVLPGGAVVTPAPDALAPQPTPGRHAITFAQTGTAQNYEVTVANPGVFTVLPRPYAVNVLDAMVDSKQFASGTNYPYTAPNQYTNGPQFPIAISSNAPRGATGGVYTLSAQLHPSLSLDERRNIAAYYTLDFSDTGVLTVVPAPEPIVIASTALTITPPATTPPPPSAPLAVASTDGSLRLDELANLLRTNTKDMGDALRAFVYSDDATSVDGYSNSFRILSDSERAMLLDLLSGKRSWTAAAGQLADNATLRNAVMPVLTKYAMDLIERQNKSPTELSPAQSRLVAAVQIKMNEQRAKLIETAEAKYKAWEARPTTLGALFDRNFPDFVSAARQDVVSQAMFGTTELGVITAGVALSGTAGIAAATAANVILPFMAHGLQLGGMSAAGAAGTMSAMAGGVIAGAIVAVAVVGTAAGKQAAVNARNESSYTALLATKNQTIDLKTANLGDPAARVDLFSAIMGAMNDAF